MKEFCQGDIIKIADYKKQLFVIISKNARSCSKVDSLKYFIAYSQKQSTAYVVKCIYNLTHLKSLIEVRFNQI